MPQAFHPELQSILDAAVEAPVSIAREGKPDIIALSSATLAAMFAAAPAIDRSTMLVRDVTIAKGKVSMLTEDDYAILLAAGQVSEPLALDDDLLTGTA